MITSDDNQVLYFEFLLVYLIFFQLTIKSSLDDCNISLISSSTLNLQAPELMKCYLTHENFVNSLCIIAKTPKHHGRIRDEAEKNYIRAAGNVFFIFF